MQIINMSKTKLNSLEPLILPKNVTSTECELFKYPYYSKEKLLKKLHRTDGIIFANKLYTIEALNANKDSMPSNFVLPESLVSINKKIEALSISLTNLFLTTVSTLLEDGGHLVFTPLM